MAVFYDLRLVYLAVLMLASQLDAAVVVYGLRGTNLPGDVFGNKPDPYVKIVCAGSHQETDYYKGNNNPTWSKSYSFSSCKSDDTLQLEVWDKDVKYDDLLGYYSGTVGSKNYEGYFSVGKAGKLYFRYDLE